TGDDVYTLQTDGVVRTIWDAGGIDTFDASGMSRNTTIDLRPGHFSTDGMFFGPLGNIGTGIAYGTTIENAVGGQGDDNIIGNDAANNLSGGSGNDTIDGGAGADTMTGGPGDDTFVVDNPGDVTLESSGQGVDTVRSSISYTLADNVENLTLLGAAPIN